MVVMQYHNRMHVFYNLPHGTDIGIWVWLVSGETLLEEKNSTGRRWDLDSGPYR